jgi:predicted SAM-dependent methyltransferase
MAGLWGRLTRSARYRFDALAAARRLKRLVRTAAPLRIVIGAAGYADADWIATDIQTLDLLNERSWRRFFRENTVDALLAEHVWEHLTIEEGWQAARCCYRFLKPGGYLRAAVPDGFHPDPKYIEYVRVGGSGAGAADHKVLYNCETFRQLFESVGFQVALLEYFDSAGVFHALDWNPNDGTIRRSLRFDERNFDGRPNYCSLIVDARKPS